LLAPVHDLWEAVCEVDDHLGRAVLWGLDELNDIRNPVVQEVVEETLEYVQQAPTLDTTSGHVRGRMVKGAAQVLFGGLRLVLRRHG
jgi:hypothetical protein